MKTAFQKVLLSGPGGIFIYPPAAFFNLPVLLDKKRVISKRYKVTGLPCNYAIDREGFLRFRCLGCSEDVKRKFEENLRELLAIP